MSGIGHTAPTVTESVKLRGVRTPDDCWDFRLVELPTLVGTPDKPTWDNREGHCSWENTRHVQYCHTQQKDLVLLAQKTLEPHMGWLEHLWINIYQHDASLLIARHTYKLKIKWKQNLKRLSWFPLNQNAIYFNDHQVRVSIMSILIFSLSIAILSMWLDSNQQMWVNSKCIKSLPQFIQCVWFSISMWPS